MDKYIQVTTTTENQISAKQIADVLINKKLAACVQIVGPITSIYRWQGKIENSQEWMCSIKTREDLYPQVEENIKNNHSYDRLWEARKIWGDIVNSSRAWGSNVRAYVTNQFTQNKYYTGGSMPGPQRYS